MFRDVSTVTVSYVSAIYSDPCGYTLKLTFNYIMTFIHIRAVQKMKSCSHPITWLIKVCKKCIQKLKVFSVDLKTVRNVLKVSFKITHKTYIPAITFSRRSISPSQLCQLSYLGQCEKKLTTKTEWFMEGKLKSELDTTVFPSMSGPPI